MRTRRPMVVPAVLAVACWLLLAAGPAALAKEKVSARLLAPLQVDAAPGERLTVEWALAWPDEQGRRRPFNAIGVFVRLLSASGGHPTIGFATPDEHPEGRYDARVAVPEGGIGGVQIGLRGSTDVLFPLENDPFAVPAGAAAADREATAGRPPASSPVWPALAGGLALLGVLAAVARPGSVGRLARRGSGEGGRPGGFG